CCATATWTSRATSPRASRWSEGRLRAPVVGASSLACPRQDMSKAEPSLVGRPKQGCLCPRQEGCCLCRGGKQPCLPPPRGGEHPPVSRGPAQARLLVPTTVECHLASGRFISRISRANSGCCRSRLRSPSAVR